MTEPLRGEIIAIGDELTTGQRLDTNTKWLAEQLTDLGVKLLYHTTVADDQQANVDVFHIATQRADVVITTGGLGPTADDLTRDSMAAAAGVELVEHQESLEHIQSLFAARGREMPPRNAVQAQFPVGAIPIPNGSGTAPGIDLTIDRSGEGSCRFFALPGVPSEMKPMFVETVAPAIQTMAPVRVTRHHLVKCYGVGESHLEAMLPDLIARKREPLVGITASQTTLTLRVTASGPDSAACQELMAPTLKIIRDSLGDIIFAEAPGSEPEPDLQHAIVQMLQERNHTLATVESMTAGELASRLGPLDSTGEQLLHAKVSPRSIDNQSESERVEQEAQNLRIQQGVDWAIAIGGLGDEVVKAAISSSESTESFEIGRFGPEEHLRSRVAKQTLNQLRLAMLKRSRSQQQ